MKVMVLKRGVQMVFIILQKVPMHTFLYLMKKHVISLMTCHRKVLLIQIFQRQLENALEESDVIYETTMQEA